MVVFCFDRRNGSMQRVKPWNCLGQLGLRLMHLDLHGHVAPLHVRKSGKVLAPGWVQRVPGKMPVGTGRMGHQSAGTRFRAAHKSRLQLKKETSM